LRSWSALYPSAVIQNTDYDNWPTEDGNYADRADDRDAQWRIQGVKPSGDAYPTGTHYKFAKPD